MDERLWAPYTYLEQIPGKDMRVRHINAFNSVLQTPHHIVEKVIALVQRLHTVSLLLDDIEDGATLRRGQPVAHHIYGTPRTINSASFVMVDTLRATTEDFPEHVDLLFDELLALHRGQGLDLYWRDDFVVPTEPEYLDMVGQKTASLYRLAVKLLQAYSPVQVDLSHFATLLGIIYQIIDDLLNLESDKYAVNKGFAEDITEGKMSFPVIHCLSGGGPRAAELMNILRQRSKNVDLKRLALNILRNSGSIAYTVAAARRHADLAKTAIDYAGLGERSLPLRTLLDELIAPLHKIETTGASD